MRIESTEGAKFWLKVSNELRTRGVSDILIAMTDGHECLLQAPEAVFPDMTLQACIVHQIRNSREFARWKDRWPLVQAARPIYTAPTMAAAGDSIEIE